MTTTSKILCPKDYKSSIFQKLKAIRFVPAIIAIIVVVIVVVVVIVDGAILNCFSIASLYG